MSAPPRGLKRDAPGTPPKPVGSTSRHGAHNNTPRPHVKVAGIISVRASDLWLHVMCRDIGVFVKNNQAWSNVMSTLQSIAATGGLKSYSKMLLANDPHLKDIHDRYYPAQYSNARDINDFTMPALECAQALYARLNADNAGDIATFQFSITYDKVSPATTFATINEFTDAIATIASRLAANDELEQDKDDVIARQNEKITALEDEVATLKQHLALSMPPQPVSDASGSSANE